MNSESVTLPCDTNQARGLGQFALDFLGGKFPDPGVAVPRQVERFHRDSIACGVSALAAGAECADIVAPRGDARCLRAAPAKDPASDRRCGSARESRGCQLLGRPRMGFQRHELRLQPPARSHEGRIRPQRFLFRRHRRRPAMPRGWQSNATSDDSLGRNPRPTGRSVFAQGT